MIDAKRIHEMIIDSLFTDEEIVDGIPTSAPIKVEGITQSVGFHRERLASHKEEVRNILKELPLEFQPEGGGGSSFLNMCLDKEGHQWGEHYDMQQLCLLAIGLDLRYFPMSKEMWHILPGGVPYFCIKK
jgi:hypothetical protein